VLVILCNSNLHCQKHPIIFSVYLHNKFVGNQNLLLLDGDQIIDVSSAVCGESSTIPVGATQQTFPYPGTVYQFDPLLFQPDNDKNKFDLNDAEIKLYSLMKSPCTVDGCKLI